MPSIHDMIVTSKEALNLFHLMENYIFVKLGFILSLGTCVPVLLVFKLRLDDHVPTPASLFNVQT